MNIAVLLAGGSGSRFGSDKVLENLCGKPVFLWSAEVFADHPDIQGIVIVGSADNIETLQEHAQHIKKDISILQGGESRFESTLYGFEEAKRKGADIVVFHNLANPGVSKKEITDVIHAAQKTGAAGVARSVSSTLRKSSGGTIPREGVFEMETPQAVRCDIFEKGVFHISDIPTDDLQIAEAAGITPEILPAEKNNRKITTKDDLATMQRLLQKDERFRTGIGQDSHRFSESGELVLGGITIKDAPKLHGNSDADAVLHALTNAISSAMGGGSLSTFSDEMCKNGVTDSSEYLRKILKDLKKENSRIMNISIAIEAGRPKLEKHFPKMKTVIAEICEIQSKDVGITVTSGEMLTECGKGEGISVFTSVLIASSNG